MSYGVCIAGLDRADRWVRPVKLPEFDFSPALLSEAGRFVVEPYNEIEFHTRGRLNNSPQSEDVEVDVSHDPHLIRTLDDRELLTIMGRIDERRLVEEHGGSLEAWLVGANRSLALTRVDDVLRAYRRDTDDGRRQRRISFRVGTRELDLSCTDLRWRSMTRGDRDEEARDLLASADVLYFSIGLTRLYKGHYWPMVVGVHPLPKMVCEVDYDNL
jgi:putative nucleic acid modification protein with dual OB domain